MYSYKSKQTIYLNGKNFIVGHNNSGKSSIFKAINFFIKSLTQHYRLPKQWKSQSNHKLTLEISLTDLESKYIVELLTIYKTGDKYTLASSHIIELLIDKFKNIEITMQWDDNPYGDDADIDNFSMKILDLDIEITYDKNHGPFIHKFDIETLNNDNPTFVSIIESVGIEQFTKSAFLNKFNSKCIVYGFRHEGLFQDNRDPYISERIKFILSLSNQSISPGRELSFLHMLGYLFGQKMSFMSEERHFVPENIPNTSPLLNNGDNLHSYLYRLQNSQDLYNRELFKKIQCTFSKIMKSENMSFDVSMQNPSNNDTGQSSTQRDKVSVTFRNEHSSPDDPIKFMESGAGIREILFLITKYFDTKQSIIFMDEPAINLHPTLIKKLMIEIFSEQYEQNQLVIITHSSVIVSNTKLLSMSNIIRIFKNNTSMITQPSDDDKIWITRELPTFHLLKLDVLFSKGVILVEGASDEIFFNALLNSINDSNYFTDDVMIISTYGSTSMPKFKKFMDAFKIPCLLLMDNGAPGKFDRAKITKLPSDLKIDETDFHDKNIMYELKKDLEAYMENLNGSLFYKIKKQHNHKPALAYHFIREFSKDSKITDFYYMWNHLKYIIKNNHT